ncbi:zinc finger protein OZF-like [Colletes gigas]|uniref:zinc finger protein OZF-like n=1 Tax=Colletes gigas TaxID=935657 RepID=UPI001C9BA049|nr:zinc finger protein OZF-like [Colletes gigas]
MQSEIENKYTDSLIYLTNDSSNNNDFYVNEVKYRSLSDVDDDSLSCRVNNNSLKIEVSDSFAADGIKEECIDTVPTVLVPVRDPVTREIKSISVPFEVKDETGLNIIKSIIIPIKDDDGSVSYYDIKNVVVPIHPELGLPPKTNALLSPKNKAKTIKTKKRDGKKLKQKKAKTTIVNKSKKQRREEESEKIPATDTPKEEVDDILQNLRTVCPRCQKSFKSEKQMHKHILRDHRKPFRCQSCYESYDSQNALDAHMKTHQKDTHLECPFCHLKYKRMSGLRTHQIRVHSSVDPKTIRDRNKENFTASADLEERKPHPLWMKTFPCQYCKKVYPQKSYLVAHKRIAHGIQKREPKSFQCNVCNKTFVTERNLVSHVNLHAQKFLCAECGRELASKYNLYLHMRTHTGERPYQCKMCPKSFAKSVGLRVHALTHTGRKPYVCDICGRGYTQRGSMMIHRRKHPGNHPPVPPILLGNVVCDSD